VEALGYAAELHLHQRRKGKGQPYVGHLLGVAAIVIQHVAARMKSIAALLHDAVEDQGGLPRLDEIREKFGDRVARIVDGCTDSYEVSGEKRDWGERKRAYIEKSRTSPKTYGSFPLRTNWPTPAKFFLTIAWKATRFSTAQRPQGRHALVLPHAG